MSQSKQKSKNLQKPRKAPAANLGPNKKSKAKRKQRATLANRANAPNQAARAEKFFLSMCSKYYLKALCDPFSLESGLACVPDLIDLPSSKLLCKARGTFAAGTTGFGWCCISPTCGTGVGDICIVSSQTGSLFTTIQASGVNVQRNGVGQFPYSAAQRPDIKQRTVGVGIRVRYLGTTLNLAGRTLGFRTQFANSCVGMDAFAALGDSAVQSRGTTRAWSQVVWLPNNQADYEYLSSDQGIDLTDTTKAMRLGFIIDGATPGSPFEYEVVYHKEYANGNRTVIDIANLSRSHSDIEGLSSVRNFFEGIIDYAGGSEVFKQAMNFISNYSPKDMSHVVAAGTLAYRAYSGM